ncbi:phage tail sheath family protein [Tunturiibacter lichenicola]|uniref:phage tail sheath family protein n=1 Tax=Tunturiibacter lichenicola TaxID=2051959 RepID=UPI003D9ADD54
MAFVSTNKAPGVYIDEEQVPGPIAPAETSTTAFIGPAQMGPLFQPTLLTTPQQFAAMFGSYIEDPQRVYATHAVNGFFAEGGGLAYFVRVGTGVQASFTLKDRATTPKPVLVLTAFKEGTAGNTITVQVDDASVASTKAARKQVNLTSATGISAVVGSAVDAANFHPGDTVLLEQLANTDTATVTSVSGVNIFFAAAVTNTYTGGDIRIANLTAGTQRIRVDSVAGIQPGTYVSVSQGGTSEQGVVRMVDSINSAINLAVGLTNTYSHKAGDPDINIKTLEFTLTIANSPAGTESFPNLSMDPRHSRYFGTIVNSSAVSIALADPPSPTPPAHNLPAVIAATALTGGAADNVANIQTNDYHRAIDTLLRVPDVALLAIPDAVGANFNAAATHDIQSYMVAHCEKVVNRFAILDSIKDADQALILAQRSNLNSDRGMASLYYPWIGISNPLGSGEVIVPPSGHVAGVYANNDNQRLVFKAPANEPITSALDLAAVLNDDEQGPLNEQGINVIRSFPGQGIRIWGARTIAPTDNTQWRYNSIRRFVNFVEASLRDGTRFAVFEPNNPTLWGTVKRMVVDFLTTQWSAGALEGTSADQGFTVSVDSSLNTPQVIALGQLIIAVTLYTVPPAEYVVFKIVQQPGGSTVTE